MARRSAKERQQITILGAVLGTILLVFVYTQRSAFLPSTVSVDTPAGQTTRAAITIQATDDLFEDTRFTSLKNNVEPTLRSSTTGNASAFSASTP